MMTTRAQSILLASVALAIVLGITISNKISERHGAGKTEVKSGIQLEKSGTRQLKQADVIYVHDTIRIARAVKQYDTLRVTERITDTVWVKQFIVAADSVKRACSEAILSCDQKDSAHKIIEAGLRLQNEGLKKELPTRTEKVLNAGKWLVFGAALEAAASHAHH